MSSQSSIQNTEPPKTVDIDPSENKIEITSEVAKKLADYLKDPTQGKTMEVELRNKLRQQYHEDICETIDVLTLLAHSAEGFHSVLAIKRRLESGQTPTF